MEEGDCRSPRSAEKGGKGGIGEHFTKHKIANFLTYEFPFAWKKSFCLSMVGKYYGTVVKEGQSVRRRGVGG